MSKHSIAKQTRVCVLFAVAVACRAPGWAADASGNPHPDAGTETATTLTEITVTAERREEPLLRVPVAVDVISAAALQNNDATSLNKAAELVPDVSIGTATTGTGAVISIRGISSSPLDAGIDQSVSVVFDDIQLSRGRIISQSLYDVKQVQVLEGPQALFFGKNSPAGVIDIESNQPASTLEGYVNAGYEFVASERYLEGAISGPLSQTLKVRFAFRGSDMNGWMRNVASPQPDPFVPGVTLPGTQDRFMPDGNNISGRMIADWTPTQDFKATARLTVGTERYNSGASNDELYCVNGVTVPTLLNVPVLHGDCSQNMQVVEDALPRNFAVNYPFANGGNAYVTSTDTLASLTLHESLPSVMLSAISGYYGQRVADAEPFDSYALIFDAEFERYGLFSQEFRATSSLPGPLNYTVGVYFDDSTRFHFNSPFILDNGPNPATGNYAAAEQDSWNGDKTYSAFGQLRWKILRSLELAGGARWTYETKDITIGNTAVSSAYAKTWLAPGDWINGSFGDHNISPQVTLAWHPKREATVYIAYKTGYKSGGFSNSSVLEKNYDAGTLQFRPELSRGEEIGYKSMLLNGKMRMQLTAYTYNYSGLQVTSYNSQTISYTIRNAASTRTQGVEESLDWLLGYGFELHDAFAYNHARYLNFPGAQCYPSETAAQGCISGQQNLAGKPPVVAPRFAYNLGGSYRVRLPHDLTAELSLSGAYSSSYELDGDNNPYEIQHGFWRLNASMSLQSGNGKWSISLIGRDLTNAYYALTSNTPALAGPYEIAGFFNRPREVILQLGYHF